MWWCPPTIFDQVVYKIRAIDFDQQCYEGKFKVYRPQFFKENYPMVEIVKNKLTANSVDQYKIEERSIVARRIISSGVRLQNLVTIMQQDRLTREDYLNNLCKEIYKFTKDKAFLEAKNVGDVMEASFDYVRRHYENLNMSKLIQSS